LYFTFRLTVTVLPFTLGEYSNGAPLGTAFSIENPAKPGKAVVHPLRRVLPEACFHN
jgi:hypothetical protein